MSMIDGTICPALRAAAPSSLLSLPAKSDLHLSWSVKYLRNTFDNTLRCCAADIRIEFAGTSFRKSKSTSRVFGAAGRCAITDEAIAKIRRMVFMGWSGPFLRKRLTDLPETVKALLSAGSPRVQYSLKWSLQNAEEHRASLRNSNRAAFDRYCF